MRVVLVLTDPSCVHYTALRCSIHDILIEVPGVTSIEVTASRTTLWTCDRREQA